MRRRKFAETSDVALAQTGVFHFFAPMRAVIRGPWVVWFGYQDFGFLAPSAYVFGRSHMDLAVPPETYPALPLQAAGAGFYEAGFALTASDEIIYFHSSERRLFRLAMPEFPCPNDISCPEGLSCQPNDTCR